MPTMALTMTSMHYSLVLQLEHMPITFAHSRVQVMQQATAVLWMHKPRGCATWVAVQSCWKFWL